MASSPTVSSSSAGGKQDNLMMMAPGSGSASEIAEQFFSRMSDIVAESSNDPAAHQHWRAAIARAIFHFSFGPDTNWVIDTKATPAQVYKGTPAADSAAQLVFQASETDFLSLIEAPRAKAVAIYSSGRIKLGGSHELFQTLKPLFQEARKQVLADRVEAARRLPRRHPGALAARRGVLTASTGGSTTATMESTMTGMPKPIFKDKNDWMADELVDLCGNCGQQFFLLRRRHHCRVCGGVFCHECSSYLVDKRRTCYPCFEDIKSKIALALRRGPNPAAPAAASAATAIPTNGRSRVAFRARLSHTPKTTAALSPELSASSPIPSSPPVLAHASSSTPETVPGLRIRTSSDQAAIDDGKREGKASPPITINGHTTNGMVSSSPPATAATMNNNDSGPEGVPRVASGGPSVAFTAGPSPGLITRLPPAAATVLLSSSSMAPAPQPAALSQPNVADGAVAAAAAVPSEAEMKVKRLEELLAQKKRGNYAMAALLIIAVLLLRLPTGTIHDQIEGLRGMVLPYLSHTYDVLGDIHYARVPGLIWARVLTTCSVVGAWLATASPLAIMAAVGMVLMISILVCGLVCRKRAHAPPRSRSSSISS